MSTRSTTHFVGYPDAEGNPRLEAIVYRHYDGYPEGAGTDIYRFFEAVEADTGDHRYTDPSYLAAKYVVFLSRQFVSDDTKTYDFLGVGVVQKDPGDIEYRYVINCAKLDDDGRPEVTCFGVYSGSEQEIPRPTSA